MTDRPVSDGRQPLPDVGRCIPGRLVKLRFRSRATQFAREESVVYPATWTKGNVLASAREAHMAETVVLVEWGTYAEDGGFSPSLWIANPYKILNYTRDGRKVPAWQ